MKTAREICEELGIKIVSSKKYRAALDELELCCEPTLEKMVRKHGQEHTIFVLRTITETKNNKRELVAPTIEAVSDIVLCHRAWWQRDAGKWLDAFDTLDLPKLRQIAKSNQGAVRVRHAMAALIHDRLLPALDPMKLL